jgi:DsbC/DsbD-like thiol-disulfide interchange protein/cytochrome c biogenesis protein CcdA
MRSFCASLFALALLAAGSGAPAFAAAEYATGALDGGEPRIEARLLVHPDRPDAATLRAGVLLTPDPGWHLYWKNPGDAGLPTRLVWRGGEAGPVRWPAPSAFQEGDDALVTFGYEGTVLLASEIRLDAGAETLGVDVDVLVCRESCIPAKLSLERPLAASYFGEAAAAVRRLFELHDEALPRDADALGFRVATALPDASHPERTSLTVRACADGAPGAPCTSVAAPGAGTLFFPGDAGVRVVDVSAARGRLALLLERDAEAPPRVSGVLALLGGDGRIHHVDVTLAAPATQPALAAGRVLAMLAVALLGGLLLNLMPCVLPVLALKAFAVAELAGSGRRLALVHGAAYTAGILASMLALATVVLSLRAAGNEVGWGFQFQSPGFLVAVSALCVVFALNLFGVFEIGFVPGNLAAVGAEAQGARRSFLEGLLAVTLATPCSAPFLGTAVGFAFASGGALVVAIFLAIGVGLAAPFLLICVFPPTARWLPRSGAWMGELRITLGFALLATVVWLVWVLGRSAGPDAVAGLLALLLVVALVARVFGRLEERRALRGLVLAAGVALVAAAPNWITVTDAPALGAPSAGRAAWHPAEVERLRAEGRPILVLFTADWCLTCKVNEQTVLESEAVEAALARGGYAVLEADWTRRDETIRRELARFGKAGVPLYLVYQPGAAEPQVLPELLGVERMLTALEVRERDHAQPMREADAS